VRFPLPAARACPCKPAQSRCRTTEPRSWRGSTRLAPAYVGEGPAGSRPLRQRPHGVTALLLLPRCDSDGCSRFPPIERSHAETVVPMHRMRRVRPSGASAGRPRRACDGRSPGRLLVAQSGGCGLSPCGSSRKALQLSGTAAPADLVLVQAAPDVVSSVSASPGCWYIPRTFPAGSRNHANTSSSSGSTGRTISPPAATTLSIAAAASATMM
jgi:hypothetical protein